MAKTYAKFNREGREGKAAIGLFFCVSRPGRTGRRGHRRLSEDSLEQVATKRAAFETLQTGVGWRQLKTACGSYIVAFFAPKTGAVPSAEDVVTSSAPLTKHVWMVVRGLSLSASMAEVIEATTGRIGAFQWPMEFPASASP